MNRLLLCTLLLFISHGAIAEKLYRWIEPDGSITFSPTPPPAGVDYQSVNAAHNNAAQADLPASIKQKPSILATSEHGLNAAQPETIATDIAAQPEPAAEKQKLTYAPDTGAKISAPITATETIQKTNQNAVVQTESIADSNKRRQCVDLNKRVLSLERRLRSPLEPVDMDNTVIAMARYQHSYDTHCVE